MSEALEFHPLTFVAEKDGVTVGRRDTESYAVLPVDGAELLRRLAEGMPVTEAAGWYQATFGELIDVTDFVVTLTDLGFVRVAGEEAGALPRVRFQTFGRAMFSGPAWICYAAIVIAAVAEMISYPRLRPHPQIVFFSSSLILVQVVLTLVQMPAMCWHEWFHVMAGRRLGLPTRLTIGRRFYFFVFETHLNGLLGVPRSKRYLPFLAGLLADLVAFSGLTLLAAADPAGDASFAARLALAIAFTVLLRLAWQGLVFMRTDPYYAITTLLGCTNLTGASSAYLHDRFRRLTWLPGARRRVAVSGPWAGDETWSERDRAIAPWFALISVIGGGALLAVLAIAVIPVMVTFISRLASGLAHGSLGGGRFWDATVTAALLLIQVTILPVLAGRRARRSPESSPVSEVTA